MLEPAGPPLEQSRACVTLSHRALDLLPEMDTTPLTQQVREGALHGAAHAYLVSGDVTPASECLPMELLAYARASEYRLLTLRDSRS